MKKNFSIGILFVFFNYMSYSQIADALNFDGINDFVTIDGIANDLTGSTNFTVEFKMKADYTSISGVRVNLFSVNYSATSLNDNNFLIIIGSTTGTSNTGRLVIYDNDSPGSNMDFQSTQVIGDNECHHIAYVRDGTTGYMYIDGALAGTHVVDYSFSASMRYSIGHDWDFTNPSDFYKGYIDEFRVWNYSRTPTQISNFKDTVVDKNSPGLIAVYNINQGVMGGNNTGINQLIDSTVNGYHGTLNNFGLVDCYNSNFTNTFCEIDNDTVNASLVFCQGIDTVLKTNDSTPGASYNWYKNGVQLSDTVNSLDFFNTKLLDSALYTCDVLINGCFFKEYNFNVDIYKTLPVDLLQDRELCLDSGNFENIDAGNGYVDYLWSNGDTLSNINISLTNYYWVSVLDVNGCVSSDTVYIRINYRPSLEWDSIVNSDCGNKVSLNENFNPQYNYLWSNNNFTPTITVENTGSYWVMVSTAVNCSRVYSVDVHIDACGIYLPNSFTPNGDGINDFFSPKYTMLPVYYELNVFNEWGGIIFHSIDVTEKWDGKYKGKIVKQDTYVYKLQYKLNNKEVVKTTYGHINVLK